MNNEEFLEVSRLVASGRYFPTKAMSQQFVEKAEQLVQAVEATKEGNPDRGSTNEPPDDGPPRNSAWGRVLE
jgi:hypothetical protein